MNDAEHGDVITITDGETYLEAVDIDPVCPGPDPCVSFHLTLRSQDSANPARIQISRSAGEGGAIAIKNEHAPESPAHTDLQVMISDLDVVGGSPHTPAISAQGEGDDPDQEYYIGVFIEGNYLEGAGDGVIQIGTRNENEQSLKWGRIFDNEIVGFEGPGIGTDGITTWHFVGKVQNNRVTSNGEGYHLSLGRTDERHTFVPSEFREMLIEHNVFYCNEQNGMHFAHGSQGIVRNNIFSLNEGASGSGLHIGEAYPGDPECGLYPPGDPDHCIPPGQLPAIPTEVIAYNNVVDRNNQGILMSRSVDFENSEFYANIASYTCMSCPSWATPAAVSITNGIRPQPWKWDFNVTFNPNAINYAPSNLEGPNDINEEGMWTEPNSNPRYQAKRAPESEYSFSYMLRSDEQAVCGYTLGAKSAAIDAGPLEPDFWDSEQPPGLGLQRCDAGAYGGQHNVWDPDWISGGSCFEYTDFLQSCGGYSP